MIKDTEKVNGLIRRLEAVIKDLKKLNVDEEPMEGQIELDVPKEPSRNQLLNEHFDYAWKLIPSTAWDSKKRVTRETKIRLYDYSKEQIKSACKLYLETQNENYRYKRDKFFNEIIFNYLDMIENEDTYKSNFKFKGF